MQSVTATDPVTSTAPETTIDSVHRIGGQRWTGVALELADLAAFVRERAIGAAALDAHGVDLYLACACLQGDPRALRWLDGDILGPACRVARRFSGHPEFEAEVTQRVRIQLLVAEGDSPPRIAWFDGRVGLRGWISVCAVRMALYVLRTQRNRREIAVDWSDALLAVSSGDPVLDELKRTYADAFGRALRDAAEQLPPRARAILRLHFAQGCSTEEVANVYAVHRVTAWRWLREAEQSLIDGALQVMKQSVPAETATLASLLDLIRSHVELSMSAMFPDADPVQGRCPPGRTRKDSRRDGQPGASACTDGRTYRPSATA